jgi:hypothetical protein
MRTWAGAFQFHSNIIQNELFSATNSNAPQANSLNFPRNLKGEGDITLALVFLRRPENERPWRGSLTAFAWQSA